jgi:hypothetical protein
MVVGSILVFSVVANWRISLHTLSQIANMRLAVKMIFIRVSIGSVWSAAYDVAGWTLGQDRGLPYAGEEAGGGSRSCVGLQAVHVDHLGLDLACSSRTS